MADPQIKQILNAFTTSFQAKTTAFSHVSNKLEPWWDWPPNNFPGVCIMSGPTEKKRFSYQHPTESDMQGEAEINIWGYVFDIANDTLTKRETLRSDIEYVILNSTQIDDVCMDCTIVSEEDDEGQLENHGVLRTKVKVKYLYNHLTP